MRPLPLLALLLLLAAGGTGAHAGGSATNRPLLGVAGQADRFERQTGQDSQVRHVFLGWGQGSTWGSPLAEILASLKPVPMLHLGTDRGRARTEAITPAQIASGAGDAYLVALNRAIADYGGQIFVRVMAEMNDPRSLYAPTRPDGRSRGTSHSPAAYRRAFRRAYVLLHGGAVDGRLRALGLPPLGRELPVNAAAELTVIWNPIAGLDPGSPRPAQAFYPGDAFVDMVGNDLYATRAGVASHAANEALYRAHPRKPYALPEWGLSVDDPGFIRKVCTFLKTRRRTRLAAFYDARPGSPYDLSTKRAARAAYRRCVTPIGATARESPPAPVERVRLSATPARGDAPLAVRFAASVVLPQPVLRWELILGDGKVQQGPGPPPDTLSHSYARDGVYAATLVVYTIPPFALAAARYLAGTEVRVGKDKRELLRLIPGRGSGKAPLALTFRTIVDAQASVARWEFVPGDGGSRVGEGRPPRFVGHTYTTPGVYRAVLAVHLGPNERLLAYVDVTVE